MKVTMRPWSFEEIQKMKTAYLENKSIKAIARMLDRTPTAVNKALTRFKIRPYKGSGPIAMERIKSEQKENAPISEFMHYATEVMQIKLALKNNVFFLRGAEIPRQQAIYKINQHRIRRHLPIFYLEEF